MNRLTCTLLSGASIVALMFGGDLAKGISAKAAPADADGTTSGFATTGDVDYLIITGDYESGQDVVVSTGDTVTGPPFASAIPLDDLPFGGPALGLFGVVVTTATVTIDGSLINNGDIAFSVTGSGLTANDVVVGIGNNGGVINGAIVNNGIVDILASDTDSAAAEFANAVGVAVTDVTGTTTFLNALGAVLSVQAFASDSAAPNTASANAIGVFQDVEDTGTGIANVTNNGTINVRATAVQDALTGAGGTPAASPVAYAAAAGIVQQVTGSDSAVAWASNGGVLNVLADALAIGDASAASASANAIGFSQFASGDSGAPRPLSTKARST